MITGRDVYEVLSALVPLYVAMILAYGSVRWWKIFTPDQCAGISRFVAVFAVPLMSFHFIAANNPYTMNFRFIAADCLQKVVILVVLFVWNFTKFGNLDWLITFFSISTLPNTLVMGIPLLRAMYGDFTSTLMVQIIVLQCVVWYTLLLFFFEYRAAKVLISEQFPPDVARTIASVEVEPDVVSLSGSDALQADAEMRRDGKLHMVVRRSNSYSSFVGSRGHVSFRDPDLNEMEIYSVPSSREVTPRALSLKEANLCPMSSGRITNLRFGYSHSKSNSFTNTRLNSSHISSYPIPNPTISAAAPDFRSNSNNNLHMFVWSNTSPVVPEGDSKDALRTTSMNSRNDVSSKTSLQQTLVGSRGMHVSSHRANPMNKSGRSGEKDAKDELKKSNRWLSTTVSPLPAADAAESMEGEQGDASRVMPPATVVTRLIITMVWRKLIRNPNTYGSVVGLVWSLIAFRWKFSLPKIIDGSITILSNTGMGLAMFSLGFFMALEPKIMSCRKREALFSMLVKFLVGPIVMAATSAAIGIRGDILRVSILQAALPQAIVPFVFAREYACHARILSTAVSIGMVVALPVTIIYFIVLGVKI